MADGAAAIEKGPQVREGQSFDQELGKKVRARRRALDMTQSQLGEIIGVRFQQIQKYERGDNRISAQKIFAIAKALDVPVEFFSGESGPILDFSNESLIRLNALARLVPPDSPFFAALLAAVGTYVDHRPSKAEKDKK